MLRIRNDLTGKKFHRLTAVKPVGKTKFNKTIWLFKCDCGTEKEINGVDVTTGNTKPVEQSAGFLKYNRLFELSVEGHYYA